MNTESPLPAHATAGLPSRTTLRWVGRLVLVVWAGIWIWFNAASFFGEVAELGVGAWVNHALLAAVILGVTVLAFLRPRMGGIALLLLTLAMGLFFRGARPEVLLMLLAPPAVAGLLAIFTARAPAPHPGDA